MEEIYDVIIIGAGSAGLTAGIYTSRARLKTLIIEKETLGGELMNRDMIENYPGYPDGIMGPELGTNIMTQAMNLGTELQLGAVEGIEIDGNHKLVKTPQGNYSARAVIIASGSHPKKLGIPGEEEFAYKGVFYCATCDGPGFANKAVAVAGGGNSGVTEALYMDRYASKVTVVELLPHLTADKILQERLLASPKTEVRCGVKIEAIRGDAEVKTVDLVEAETGQRIELEVNGILIHVGLEVNTEFLKGSVVPLNEKGQVLVDDNMETSVSGVFAAGDARHNSPMQISTAVGDGATAAISTCKYLSGR